MNIHMTNTDPHRNQLVRTAGASFDHARAAMVLLHGRGAAAEDILTLAPEFGQPDFAYMAPQAAGFTWYPQRFLEPLERNEPWLTSALSLVSRVLQQTQEAGIPPEKTILLGFSQGACLALEWMARNARRYGGAAGLSGGLIGPEDAPRDYPGSLDGTPVFLGCSDIDPHIPKERVAYTADVLSKLGGDVTQRLYPGMGHTVNQDEINYVREMMEKLVQS
jgi:predicted esterase